MTFRGEWYSSSQRLDYLALEALQLSRLFSVLRQFLTRVGGVCHYTGMLILSTRPERIERTASDLAARRCGVKVQGATKLALTKLDVPGLPPPHPSLCAPPRERRRNGSLPLPDGAGKGGACVQIHGRPGCAVSGVRRREDLPAAAENYMSDGPERDSIILR